MPFYHKVKTLYRKAFTPITIMLIPHGNARRVLNLNVPAVGILLSIVCSFAGFIYFCSLIPDVIRYQDIEMQLSDYSKKLSDFNATLLSLKKAEKDLHSLISLGSKEKILERVESSDMGAFDVNQVQQQIESSMQTVSAIKDYLRTQKGLYLATPKGLPVPGPITSAYGGRINPITGHSEFHRGLDISASAGSPIAATADGVVSFAGWNGGGGNLVVIAHGQGFFTYYAHNSKMIVEIGQRVKRGEVVSYVGSTGSTTGSHCHYEVWHHGKCHNPLLYMEEKS
jgi:murein DD-endopeptidase MepM/ murein hydrolase activator NlpD